MAKKLKQTFAIHHWCGLIAGIFILVISLSGAVLVFDDNIDEASFRQESTLTAPANSLRIDASFERVRQQNPGWEVRIPSLPAAPTQALHYELRQGQLRKWIFVHPVTGSEQATVAQAHNRFSYLLLNLHYNLLAGTAGKIVVLLAGLALLLLTITGFLLYRKSILKVLTFKKRVSGKNRRAFFSSLHNIVGVWSLVFNLFMCVTGLSLAITVVGNAFKGGKKEIVSPAIPVSIDAMLLHAGQTYPAFQVTTIRFPKNAEGKLQLLGRQASDPAYYGKYYSSLQFNYKTGEMGKADFLKDQPWSKRFLTVLHPLHFGDYAGLFVQLLYCVGGIMPGVLSISGFILWRFRPKRTTRKAPAAAYKTA
ncbi:PepSY-associated TM helix domain-containing protein [Rufibacter psychrotolerans]|uniref:PepSY-associated TM helix domain-containing protein n=1 Tax=Rufibacter psychrotolerans TaxID=2812556 RepID=UPI0019685534|nr:PepSY-associated TM helix domain-containing protein [Rufibacter sp. SYSU D00308]